MCTFFSKILTSYLTTVLSDMSGDVLMCLSGMYELSDIPSTKLQILVVVTPSVVEDVIIPPEVVVSGTLVDVMVAIPKNKIQLNMTMTALN